MASDSSDGDELYDEGEDLIKKGIRQAAKSFDKYFDKDKCTRRTWHV